jgi:hypothetical protein
MRESLAVERAAASIKEDCNQHKKPYNNAYYPFLCKVWTKRAGTLWDEQELPDLAVGF